MANSPGTQLKYGPIKGEDFAVAIPLPMGASEVIAAKSGRFVKNDGSGRMEIAGAGSTLLMGWVELPENANFNSSGLYTCSSTEGGDIGRVYFGSAALHVVFRIPVNAGTFIATMRGKTCDLSVVASIEGAVLNLSSEDTIIILDGDLVSNNWVDVVINPAKLTFPTGVI